MKKMLVLVLLLCFALSAWAFSFNVRQYGFFKGEELLVNGSCESSVLVRIASAEKEIFSKEVECENGLYALRQKISFLYPSGELTVFGSEKGVVQKKTILVRPSRESAFLTVSIGSPTKRSVARTETVDVSVSVSNAGQPVEKAMVQSWGPDGKPFELQMVQPGSYSAQLFIPFDAQLKDWNTVVVVQAETGEGMIGGEQSFSVPIVEAPMVLRIESPKEQNLPALSKILFRVNVQYQNGSLLNNPVVVLQQGEQNIALEDKGNGFFETMLQFSSKESGLQKFVLTATDAANNRATQEIQFFVAADFQSVFFSYLPFLLVAGVLIAIVAFIVIPVVRKRKTGKQMEKRRKEIERELVELQKDHFEKNLLSKEAFEQKNAALEQELEEINKKLNTPKR